MKITTYAIVIAALLVAGMLLRVYLPESAEITHLASSGVQRGIIRVNIAAFWLMIVLVAVVSRLWGPKNWAITIPIRGENTFYAIPLNRVIFWLLVVITSAAAVSSALKRADAGNMKIRTIQRNFGTPVELNPLTAEYITYVQGNRRRTEERRVQRNPLWPGGPRVSFYEPHGALIETCEGDTKKAFTLDLDSRTYAPITLRQKIDAEQAKAFRDRAPKAETPVRPNVRQEITTRDTGERKQEFGYTARHVITTYTVTPLGGTDVIRLETVTDGWYIDLDTRIPCDPVDETPSEGTTYRGVRLVVGDPNSTFSASPPSLVQLTYVGKPETGFPIWIKRTTHRGEQVTISENEVTELSMKPLDPRLFEVPANFRSVERNLPWPRAALWARWLAWGHSYWVRFRHPVQE